MQWEEGGPVGAAKGEQRGDSDEHDFFPWTVCQMQPGEDKSDECLDCCEVSHW